MWHRNLCSLRNWILVCMWCRFVVSLVRVWCSWKTRKWQKAKTWKKAVNNCYVQYQSCGNVLFMLVFIIRPIPYDFWCLAFTLFALTHSFTYARTLDSWQYQTKYLFMSIDSRINCHSFPGTSLGPVSLNVHEWNYFTISQSVHGIKSIEV